MRFFIDETGLTLPELEATRIREVLEDFLDLLAAARPHPDEPVVRSREIWLAPVRPGLSFCELVFPTTPAPPLLRDPLRRLAHALDRLPEWEEQTEPDQLEVVLDGELRFAPTLAEAGRCRLTGEAVGCLVFETAGRRAERTLQLAGVAVRLRFLVAPADRRLFFREVIELEDVQPERFVALVERAFPALAWVPEALADLRTHKRSFFGPRRPLLVHHLSVLDEEGARIFAEEPQQHARSGRLRGLGVESSSESGTTRSNSQSRREHTRNWNGQAREFWWHTKLTPTDGRIHFLYEAGPDGGAQSDRIVIGICTPHLTV